MKRFGEVFLVALRLGLTSFGGPIAHVGYFRQEYVTRQQWLDERAFASLVALCHFLPGPTSSQLGFAIGLMRAGITGGIAAFVGFTLPSAALMVSLGFGVNAFGDLLDMGLINGLKAVAAAVLVVALWGMTKQLAPDFTRASVACASFFAALILPAPFGILAILMVAAIFGVLFLRSEHDDSDDEIPAYRLPRFAPFAALGAFVVLVVGGVLAATLTDLPWLDFVAVFLRSGALVFGGGHVVLVMLSDIVAPTNLISVEQYLGQIESLFFVNLPSNWITGEQFLAGYGAVQAIPGPLFTFAGYLGAVADGPMPNWLGAFLALSAIFVPSLLLVIGLLPYWNRVRSNTKLAAALMGVNAAVVGFLAAAMYEHVWLAGLRSLTDAGIALGAFALLAFVGLPPWLVVVLGGLAGQAIGLIHS